MKRHLATILLLACFAGFAFGLVELFRLRFAVGDVYPEYSSLRSDPLGTMAFYESLAQMRGLSVRRDFSAANELPDGKQTAYLHLAAGTPDWVWLPEDLAREVEHFLARGGRLAITFFPETAQPRRPVFDNEERDSDKSPKAKSKGGRAKAAKKKNKDAAEGRSGQTSLKQLWGVEFAFVPLALGEADTYAPARVVNRSGLPLPATLDWHSAAVFTNLAQSWRTIYARGIHPVVVERQFGSGSVLMATDSYFLSNEALRQEPHADLLAWLVGTARQVVFDEAHFGIVDTSGVASLIRKYRLHGLAAGLLLLAGLFIWKNSLSFVPPYPDEQESGPVAGREAAAGLVNLLRRNVSARDVLKTCFAEWKKSFAQGARQSTARVEQAQAVLKADNARPARQRDPIRTYQEICRILKTAHFRDPK